MIVCITEKPSVTRGIAEILDTHTRKEKYIERSGHQVAWTFRHLCTLKEPHEYTPDWKSWSLSDPPMIPPRFGIKLIENSTYERQFHIIEGLIQSADEIINCGDVGQEGELIQRWVMQKTSTRCPVKRLWISSLTEEAVREGFTKLKDQTDSQSLYEAGLSRAMGNWLLGMNATRLYTAKYGQNEQVLSIGCIQTPTLALTVNRQLEITNFEPEQYWELETSCQGTTFPALIHKNDEEIAVEEGKNGRRRKVDNPGIDPIANREKGGALVERIKSLPFVVTSVGKKGGKESAPRLSDPISLQVECNRKFVYSVDETLKLIQSFYEKKVATYPRVDTTFLSDDIYPKCPVILKGLHDYGVLTAPLVGTTFPKSKKIFDNSKVTDHHAIIPTGIYAQNLTDMERRVYGLIARRFIAVFYPDCKIPTTTVMGKVDRVEFRVTGKQILGPGWRVVFVKNIKDPAEEKEEENENILPAFVRGKSSPRIPDLNEKWTQPPRPYTEATLLRAVETAGRLVDNDKLCDTLKENSIGRPSTRAAIVEVLFKRNCIRKERKNLIATPTGVELVQLIHEELLKSAELTGIWEKKPREIKKKTYDTRQFLGELKRMVSEMMMNVLSDNTNRRITIQDAVAAKAEEREEKETKKRERKSSAPKEKKPRTEKATGGVSSNSAPSPAPVTAPASAPSTTGDVDAFVGQPCPFCGKGTIIEGETAYGCSEWRNGCTFRRNF